MDENEDNNNPFGKQDTDNDAHLYYKYRQRVTLDDLIDKVTNKIIEAVEKGKSELNLDVPFRVEVPNKDPGRVFNSNIMELFDKKELEDNVIPVLEECGYKIEFVPWASANPNVMSSYTHLLKIKL